MIHSATKKDLEQIKSILITEFHTNDLIQDERTFYEVYGDMEGFICYSNLYDHMDLNYIWVDASSRRKGIASKLVQKLLLEAQKDKIDKVVLEVSESNEKAILLYKKMGFEIVSKRKNYYGNQDALLMMLEIR